MPRSVFGKLQVWLSIAAIGLLTTAASIETVLAREGEGLSLADLAGSYAGKGGGFLTLCDTAPCTDKSARQYNDAEVIQLTLNRDGKWCSTTTAVDSPADGSPAPAFVHNFIIDGSNLSYDPRTGIGAWSATFYIAENNKNGVRCKGANVVNPNQEAFHATIAFTVAQEPALHFDFVFTSFTAGDGSVGGSVISDTVYIQHN